MNLSIHHSQRTGRGFVDMVLMVARSPLRAALLNTGGPHFAQGHRLHGGGLAGGSAKSRPKVGFFCFVCCDLCALDQAGLLQGLILVDNGGPVQRAGSCVFAQIFSELPNPIAVKHAWIANLHRRVSPAGKRLKMRWPWTAQSKRDSLVVSWTGSTLAYVQAHRSSDGECQVTRFGVEHQGTDGMEEFFRRIQALGLHGSALQVVLRPEQYQLLQIDAPQVPPEEIRSAARWKIREMVNTHVDDLTLDLMRVGDDRVRATGQLFVVVARTALVRDLLQLGEKLRCAVQVIDIHDTAQRNLQSLLARKDGLLDRANAALMIVDNNLALLTISAHEELFYSRRIELGQGFVESRWMGVAATDSPSADSFSAVPEYVPGGSSFDAAFSDPYGGMPSGGTSSSSSSVDERSQRFVVEVQRSLDVWERTWSSVPLEGVKVFAGARSQELAQWLSLELGLPVGAMELAPFFPGFSGGSDSDRSLCWPLLGALLREP